MCSWHLHFVIYLRHIVSGTPQEELAFEPASGNYRKEAFSGNRSCERFGFSRFGLVFAVYRNSKRKSEDEIQILVYVLKHDRPEHYGLRRRPPAESMPSETLRESMRRTAMMHLRLLSFRAGDIFQSVGDYDRCPAMRARLHNRRTRDRVKPAGQSARVMAQRKKG
jgi:hypothetical protein